MARRWRGGGVAVACPLLDGGRGSTADAALTGQVGVRALCEAMDDRR